MRRLLLTACTAAALALPLAARAATIGADPPETAATLRPGTVSTQATAHRRLPNTVADIAVGIEVEGHDVPTVTRQLGERSQALLAFLRTQGAQRLSTAGISVDTQTHTIHGGPDVIVGYVGR